MTNVESMDYTHSPFHHCQPLRYHALTLLTLRVGANFAGASKPRDMIRSFTHKPPYIFLALASTTLFSIMDGPKNVMQPRLRPAQDEKPSFCHDFFYRSRSPPHL